jgi:rSAM/selenodomain-associated transferase 1
MKAIVLMAREPRPNLVKTRLTPPLDSADASRIYHSFLLDKIEQVYGLDGVGRFVAYTPDSSREFFSTIVPKGLRLIPQKGEDLGEKLANLSSSLLDEGYDGVMLMDSDTPNLPSGFTISGLEALNENDLVVGPCEDGGYYLIGLSRKIPEIFRDIPWSTPEVTPTTIKKSSALGLRTAMLQKWYDIDTFDDLKRLKRELDALLDNSEAYSRCKNTHRTLSEIL